MCDAVGVAVSVEESALLLAAVCDMECMLLVRWLLATVCAVCDAVGVVVVVGRPAGAAEGARGRMRGRVRGWRL
jgi:hypothetical protein